MDIQVAKKMVIEAVVKFAPLSDELVEALDEIRNLEAAA